MAEAVLLAQAAPVITKGLGVTGKVVDKTPGASFMLGFINSLNPINPLNIITVAIYTTIISIIIYRTNPQFLRNNKATDKVGAKTKVTKWRATWVGFLIGWVIHLILGTIIYGFLYKGVAKGLSTIA